MTSEATLSLLDELCNQARNSMHATFGLMDSSLDSASEACRICWNASRTSADRLLRTIDDMRELVSGQTPPSRSVEEIDLAVCVSEIVELLNLAVEGASAKAVVELLDEPIVRQDRRALEQVLARILKLALDRSRTGLVRVAVLSSGEDRVRIGIVTPSSDVAQQLAEWFNAGDELLKFDKEPAAALVSAVIAGRRVRALGGTVEFVCDSGAPTGLAIYLPRRIAAAGETSAPHDTLGKSLQVLVAEDSDESFALTELLLKNESVDRARTGLEAIDKVRERRFDVVFMDIHMPGMGGYDSIRAIRDWETQSGNARTAIVVLSSDDIETQTHQAAQSGCSGYLRKPVRQSDLLELLAPLRASRDLDHPMG
jgi:two-component system, sensor histidine kinase